MKLFRRLSDCAWALCILISSAFFLGMFCKLVARSFAYGWNSI